MPTLFRRNFAAYLFIIRCSLLTNTYCLSNVTGDIPKNYDFSLNKTVGIYIKQSGQDTLDRTYASVMNLQFISLGYKVVDVNSQVTERHDKISRHKGANDIGEWLLEHNYGSTVNALVVAAPEWDSTVVVTYAAHQDIILEHAVFGQTQIYGGWKVPELSCELSIFDVTSKARFLTFEGKDTCRLYSEGGNTTPSYGEYPWIAAARQVSKALNLIPVCAVEDTTRATFRFPIEFYVDESYRNKFPNQWKERLQRRLLYASDILRKQFDIELELVGFYEWRTQFSGSMGYELERLWQSTQQEAKSFRIGVTVDPELLRAWRYRSTLGIAFPVGTLATISAQPSFPDATDWNSLEEALTLVHEVAHLLGAGHSPTETSIMYPVSGSLSFQFDDLNKLIIDSMKQNFFSRSEEQRLQRCIRLLTDSRSTPLRNTINIISLIARSIRHLEELTLRHGYTIPDSIVLTTLLTKEITDLPIRHAVEGYIDYKNDRLERAEEHFAKAIELQPNFAEAHHYLSLVLRRMGKSDEAKTQRETAEEFKMPWIDE